MSKNFDSPIERDFCGFEPAKVEAGDGLPLPCPFCGKHPKVGEQRGSDESGEQYGYSYIECIHHRGVFVGVHADSAEDCLRLWNEREQLKASLLREQKLKELLKECMFSNSSRRDQGSGYGRVR